MAAERIRPLVHFVSLGCAKNLVDSEEMVTELMRAGFGITNDPAAAAVAVVNTCGFVRDAREESIDVLLELAKNERPDFAGTIAAGCLAERWSEELRESIPELGAVIGVGRPKDVARAALKLVGMKKTTATKIAPARLTPRHWGYLRIADGCSNKCAYCQIPAIRGPLTSRPERAIMADVERLLLSGAREICVIAQDTSAYGLDTRRPGAGIVPLLEKLSAAAGKKARLRLLYLHPQHVTDELLHTIGGLDNVVKYLDLPIQHASDKVLTAMGRKTVRRKLIELYGKIRQLMPGGAVRTTVLVGFPGEGRREFNELLRFIGDYPFDRLGAFTYSPEEGTRAIRMKDRPDSRTAKRRLGAVVAKQREISARLLAARVGDTLEVLVDAREDKGNYSGRSELDAPDVDGAVFFKSTGKLAPGDLVRVTVTSSGDYDLFGERTG